MLLPFFAALPAQVDATATISPTTSAIYGNSAQSHYTMALAAADATLWTRILVPRYSYIFDVSGHYGRAFYVSGTKSPPRDLSARSHARIDIASTPLTNFVFLADGFVSSRIGLRASDELAVRDPFSTSRMLDGWSTQSSFYARLVPRASLHFDLRYAQTGAVAADLPSAVGIDTHAIFFTAAASFQVTRRFSMGPSTRLGYTHFNHALLDVNFTRGPADVESLAVLGFGRYDLGPRTRASLIAGATLTSAPPGAKDLRTIAKPDVRLEIRSYGRRFGGMGALSFGYQSVGPRIGFGMDYSALLDLWARPFRGGARRDVLVHLLARGRWANAELPLSYATNSTPGKLTTAAWAMGSTLMGPIGLGISLSAGIDLEFVATHIDPIPRNGDPPATFRALLTLGLVASTSTDRTRLLPRDPLPPPSDARRAAPIRAVRRNESTFEPDEGDDENDD